jgi:hypothetical protein
MKTFFTALTLVLLAGTLEHPAQAAWEDSLITVQATRKAYSYSRPWTRRSTSIHKMATVIGQNEFLTTAEGLQDLTMLRVQRRGRGQWHPGRLKWVDYHANIAVVEAVEEEFYRPLVPVQLAHPNGGRDGWTIVRWKNGNVEKRAAEFNQFLVQDGRLTFIQHLQMEASSEIDAVGWGEPLVSNGKVIAIATGQIENNVRFLPVSFFERVLESRRAGKNGRLGYFPFVWAPVGNPETFKFLKLPGYPRGAMVLETPAVPIVAGKLKPRDLILEVDGNTIDNEGYYRDPDHGLLILENLSTRGKLAGDILKFKVWRDGQAVVIDYELPAADFGHKLVPEATYDTEPEYLVAGGLVFQPLTVPLLQAFGEGWRRRAPFLLSRHADAVPDKKRSGLTVVSMVLPDPFNLGYQDLRWTVVDKVNGKTISSIGSLRQALEKPVDGFHTIDFMKGSQVEHIVLDAQKEPEATARILRHYRIPAPTFFAPKQAAK